MPFVQRIVRASLLIGALIVVGGGRAAPRQASTLPAASAPFSHNLSDYAISGMKDLDTTMKAVFHDDNASRKISKDAGFIYQLKGNVHVRYKEESNFRVDGVVRGFKASLIVNDTRQTYRLAALDIKQTVDMSRSPGKRTSLFELGMISQHYLTYARGEFQGERSLDGVPCVVFKITFRDSSHDTSHRTVWIDPRTRITLKREEYLQENQGGKLRDIWRYREPQEVAPGLFFPSRMELDNSDGEKAGETEFINTHVNVGLEDSIFSSVTTPPGVDASGSGPVSIKTDRLRLAPPMLEAMLSVASTLYELASKSGSIAKTSRTFVQKRCDTGLHTVQTSGIIPRSLLVFELICRNVSRTL